MTRAAHHKPGRSDAQRIAVAFAGEEICELNRYETGLCHWVYHCLTESGRTFVLRVALPKNRSLIKGGITISSLLAERGIPVAQVLGGNFEPDDDEFPWMAVEHLPGRDLGKVYAGLSSSQKAALAHRIVSIQNKVAALGTSSRCGYTHHPSKEPDFSTWDDVVDHLVERSLDWLAETSLDADFETRLIRRRLEELRPTLRAIEPVPFLDDLTTKNVLVDDGRLSGIVDVDELCFGDPLIWVGLTRMSLLSAGHDAKYASDLLDELDATTPERQRCDFYTGLFAFVFLSEQGLGFSGPAGEIDDQQVQLLREALHSAIA